MGLTSLSYLNRSGVYGYWEDNWDSMKLYRNNLYFSFFFKAVIREILSGAFFNIIFALNKRNPGYKFKYKATNSKSFKNVYFSKVWYLRYQNWLVVSICYYKFKLKKRKRRRKKSTLRSLNSRHLNIYYLYSFGFKKNYNYIF